MLTNFTNLDWGLVATIIVGTLIVLSIPFVFFALLYLFREMAKRRFLFTYVDERTGQNIERNGQFKRSIMSVTGYKFRGNSERVLKRDEHGEVVMGEDSNGNPVPQLDDFELKYFAESRPHPWDVIPDPKGEHERKFPWSLLGGIHLIGIPIVDQVGTYRMTWTSKEQMAEESGGIRHIYKTNEKELYYILLVKKDIYMLQIDTAEDRDGMPLLVTLAVTASIRNPFRAVYGVVHWMEALENQLTPEVRAWARRHKYEEMDTRKSGEEYVDEAGNRRTAESMSEGLMDLNIVKEILREYGVHIRMIQVDNIDPSGELGTKYRELSTALYEAKQMAAMKERDADAERHVLEQTVGYVASDHSRLEAWRWQNIARLRGTYVEGGSSVKPVIPVSNPPEMDNTE